MSEESTTPDLVALTRRRLDAVNKRDSDAVTRFFATDAGGVSRAVRGFAEEWLEAWEEFRVVPEEFIEGGDVVVAKVRYWEERG